MVAFAFEIFLPALLYQGPYHGDDALAVHKVAESDDEEGFHPRNHYRRPHLRLLGRNQTLSPVSRGTSVVEQVKAEG